MNIHEMLIYDIFKLFPIFSLSIRFFKLLEFSILYKMKTLIDSTNIFLSLSPLSGLPEIFMCVLSK